jgi:pimeloyl-CoA synthetase
VFNSLSENVMKDQKVTTTQDAQALIGVAIAGDSDLESALEVLVTQATRKSQGKGSQFQTQMSEYMDSILAINESRLVKAQARKHHERAEFANGKTLSECVESQYFDWADLKYDIVTCRYLVIVDGPSFDPEG